MTAAEPSVVVVLRLGPPDTRPRPERINELERIIGSRPIVGSMSERDVAAILEEAGSLKAVVIALDIAVDRLGPAVAREAARRNIAVVVAPHVEFGRDSHGRRTHTFHGYERVNEDGELSPLTDGALAVEIEGLQARRHQTHETENDRDDEIYEV